MQNLLEKNFRKTGKRFLAHAQYANPNTLFQKKILLPIFFYFIIILFSNWFKLFKIVFIILNLMPTSLMRDLSTQCNIDHMLPVMKILIIN